MKKVYNAPCIEILKMTVLNGFMDMMSVPKGEETVDNSSEILSKEHGDWDW